MLHKDSDIVVFLEQRGRLFWTTAGTVLIALLGLVDHVTGYELSFALFYLIPISLLAWFAGRGIGLTAAAVSAATWLIADITSGHVYSNVAIYAWNTLIRLLSFVIVSLLLSSLRYAPNRRRRESTT